METEIVFTSALKQIFVRLERAVILLQQHGHVSVSKDVNSICTSDVVTVTTVSDLLDAFIDKYRGCIGRNVLRLITLLIVRQHHEGMITELPLTETCFLLLLVCRLLQAAWKSELPVKTQIHGFRQCCEQILQLLRDHSNELPLRVKLLSNDEHIKIFVYNRIVAYPGICRVLGGQHQRMIRLQVSELFGRKVTKQSFDVVTLRNIALQLHHQSAKEGTRIIYHQIEGTEEDCQLMENCLLMELPSIKDDLLSQNVEQLLLSQPVPLIVAAFESSLELPHFATYDYANVSISSTISAKQEEDQLSIEYEALTKFAAILQRSGINCVVCQKRVHPHLQRELQRRNILCLPRLSVRYIGAFLRLSGARLLQDASGYLDSTGTVLPKSSLGLIQKLDLIEIAGRFFYSVIGMNSLTSSVSATTEAVLAAGARDRMRPFVTVVVVALHQLDCEIITGALKDSLQLLKVLQSRPYILPGHGMWQHILADCLQRNAMKPMNNKSDHSSSIHRSSFDVLQQMHPVLLSFANDVIDGNYYDLQWQHHHENDDDTFGQVHYSCVKKSINDTTSRPLCISTMIADSFTDTDTTTTAYIFHQILCTGRYKDGECVYFQLLPYDTTIQAFEKAIEITCIVLDIDEEIELKPKIENF